MPTKNYFFTMATIVFDGIKFFEKLLRGTSQGIFLSRLVKIGLAVSEEIMFKETVDDARRAQDHP